MRRALCAVALLALACLLLRAARVGLAGDYIDPISKITAQDEALYAHSAIAMARDGDWLTPRFMGRYALYKPPLLVWTAAVSSKLLGISRISLRLPIAILSALAVGLIFLWAGELAGWQAGAVAAALLLSNHLWQHDGHALHDRWLAARLLHCGLLRAVLRSLAGIACGPAGFLGRRGCRDPHQRDRRACFRWVFWDSTGWPYAARSARLSCASASPASLALALAAPWFLYQFAVHPRWFWTEHIAVEILGFGAGAPPQTSQENQALFYLMRLAVTDPLLLAAAAVAIPAFLSDLRRRTSAPVLLAAWIAVMLAAMLGWQYRNASYLAAAGARARPAGRRLGPVPHAASTLPGCWWCWPPPS